MLALGDRSFKYVLDLEGDQSKTGDASRHSIQHALRKSTLKPCKYTSTLQRR